jgi:hypothetical protein
MSGVRYRKVTSQVPLEEAKDRRAREVSFLRHRIEVLQDEKRDLESMPLTRTTTKQVEVHPGDEGYESADICWNPYLYQGEVKWRTISS